jgi:uncharacterized membrane protein
MQTVIFLALRAAHVFLAAIWFGSTVFISELLVPALDAAGPAGGQIMGGLNRRITVYMAILAGTTVLTGIYLFWHFTGGFDPAVSRTNAGRAFGIGGAAGLVAAIIGGSVVGRSANKLGPLMGQMATAKDKTALLQEVNTLRQRMKIGTRLVLVLQVIALVTMAIGHYI